MTAIPQGDAPVVVIYIVAGTVGTGIFLLFVFVFLLIVICLFQPYYLKSKLHAWCIKFVRFYISDHAIAQKCIAIIIL